MCYVRMYEGVNGKINVLNYQYLWTWLKDTPEIFVLFLHLFCKFNIISKWKVKIKTQFSPTF